MNKRVFIASAARTPIGAFSGGLSKVTAIDLGVTAVTEAIRRAKLVDRKNEIDEVNMGCILQAGLGQGVARQISIKSNIPVTTPAFTTNMLCGSGLFTVIQAVRSIKAGEGDTYISGGTESMSNAPYLLSKARSGYRMGHGAVEDSMIRDGLWEVFNNYHMGITAENLAEKFGITREAQDIFAYESQMKTKIATDEGRFVDEIVPVTYMKKKAEMFVTLDEHPKPKTTLDTLAKLRPAFKKDGTVTAGNSSGINDGASALVIVSEEQLKTMDLEPLAEITGWGVSGVEPEIMGIGPVDAVKKTLAKTSTLMWDIDLIEANEAFAAQSLAVAKSCEWDNTRVNVNGGAIALGHPIGASGARILTSLLYEMKRRDLKKGLATLCVGGGMGVAIQVQR